MERPENVLGTSRINLPWTCLECEIRTSPGRHFRMFSGSQAGTSLVPQIGTSSGQSNTFFRGCPGDVTLEEEVLGTFWGPILAGWVTKVNRSFVSKIMLKEIVEILFHIIMYQKLE